VSKLSTEQVKLLWDAYAEWSKHLRTWLVAYGIGAPILFLSRKEVWDVLAASPDRRLIAKLFLGGVALQVGVATLNKWSSWGYYSTQQWPAAYGGKWWAKPAEWLVDQFWVDLLADVLTLAAFITATFLTLNLFTP
jgi:hypothetical protein